jgi:hypothetical protein
MAKQANSRHTTSAQKIGQAPNLQSSAGNQRSEPKVNMHTMQNTNSDEGAELVTLVNGGVRVKNDADRKRETYLVKAVKNADAAAAFDAASHMEEYIRAIEHCASTLHLLRDSSGLEDSAQSAITLVANVLEEAVEQAEELRSSIFHKTWAYKFAPDEIVYPERKPKPDYSNPMVQAAIHALGSYLTDGTLIPKKVVTDLASFQAQSAKKQPSQAQKAA